jgi:hypothetical protein
MKHTNIYIYIYINREAVVAPVKQMLGIKAPQSAELRENPCIQTKINTDILIGGFNHHFYGYKPSKMWGLLVFQPHYLVGGAITILKNDGVRQWEG